MSTTPTVPQEEQTPDWYKDAPQVGTPQDESGGLLDTVKHYWRALDTPLIPDAVQSGLDQEKQAHQEIIQYEIAHDNPWRAKIAAGYFGLLEAATDMGKAMLTPKQLAFTVATSGAAEAAGLAKIAKTTKVGAMLANGYFSWRGAQQLLTPQQANETPIEAVGRQVAGGGEALLGAIGVKTSAADLLHPVIQNRLGLSGDLAGKVADEVAQAKAVEVAAKAQVDSAQQIGKGVQANFARDMASETDSIVAQAAKVVVVEQARAEATYEDAIRRATGPVTDAADLRTEITNTLEANGIQEREIPRSIFNAIPGDSTTARALTASEMKATTMARQFVQSGMSNSDVRASLVNLGYVPKQVDAIMTVAGVPSETSMSFEATTRVKGDLWSAANSASDPQVRNALFEAYKNIDGLLQRTAEEQGFGPSFTRANAAYATFKRELGVGEMADFVQASNISEQTTLDRMSKLLSPQDGETILKLMKVAGVDVSGLEALSADRAATAAGTKQAVTDITAQASAKVAQIGNDSIVPGVNSRDLEGLSTGEIRRQALTKLANNARKAGIANPVAYLQLGIGMLRLAAGSMFGTFQIAAGGSRIGFQRLMQQKSFQDWMIAESGVTTAATPAFRRALRTLAQSSVPERAADTVIHAPAPAPPAPKANEVRTLTPPNAPTKPPGRISIAR